MTDTVERGAAPSWEVVEIGRLLHAHRLDATLAAAALGLSAADAERLKQGEPGPAFADLCPERLALVLNILVRIEVRCGHDGRAMRAALDRPFDALAGGSIVDGLREGPALAGLRRLREVAGQVPVVKIGMWRTPDRYS